MAKPDWKKTLVAVMVPPDIKKAVRVLAAEAETTISSYVGDLIAKHVKGRGREPHSA
jgi:hypothetical protein